MKLYHITKNGTLHFQLKNGRLAAVYPSTGYVRVAHSLDGFVENRFRVGLLNRFNKAVEDGNPGNITMWPINKRIKTKTMHRYIWICTTKPAGLTKFTSTLTKRTTKWSPLIANYSLMI